ncbi:hypothetical protein BUE81_07405, partial [Escherichia coli]
KNKHSQCKIVQEHISLREYKKEQLTHIMKCHDAVQFPYLYNDILFFIYFLKCATWLFNRSRFIILK